MQKGIVRLLSRSPLPWTSGMLCGWFGRNVSPSIRDAVGTMRIWKIEPNLYTANKNYVPPLITDEMIERYMPRPEWPSSISGERQ